MFPPGRGGDGPVGHAGAAGGGVRPGAAADRHLHRHRPQVRDWLDGREREYVEAYRAILGFSYLILAH